MITTRNTKGQFARKKDTKKAVKKPTKAQREMERREALLTEYFRSISEQTSAILKQGDKLEQIQRDIEQVRTLAHQTRTNSRANTVILNKTLAGVDLLKSVTVNEGRDTNVVTPPAQPEEPKAEPWVPKAGMHVVFLDDTWHAEVHKGAIEVESGPDRDGHWKTIAIRDYERGIFFAASNARPATPEEIAEAEREEKLKKLVRGCRVDTPDGEGIYLGRDGSECGREHIVSPDNSDSFWISRYTLDQLTPLT